MSPKVNPVDSSGITYVSSSTTTSSSFSSKALILKPIRLFSLLTSRTLTVTVWPSSKASCGVAICLWEIWEMWTNPSTPGKISTKAPNEVKRLTLPSNTEPTAASDSTLSQGQVMFL